MPVDWGLSRPQGGNFDYLKSLRAIGQIALEKQRAGEQNVRQLAGQQVQSGNYQGAQSIALQGGDVDLARSISGLQGDHRKRAGEEGRVMAAAAARLKTLPPDQREAAFTAMAPVLTKYGFSHDELAGVDLSPEGLDSYETIGRSLLDHTDAQQEPNVIRTLRAVGIDPQSSEGRDIVTRSLAAPKYFPNGDGTFTVVGGGGVGPGGPARSPSPSPSPSQGPAVGTVEDGYQFRGGNPADPNAWEQVGGAPSQGGATFP